MIVDGTLRPEVSIVRDGKSDIDGERERENERKIERIQQFISLNMYKSYRLYQNLWPLLPTIVLI